MGPMLRVRDVKTGVSFVVELRTDTYEAWESVNPVLLEGEIGVVTGGYFPTVVFGDGETQFKKLIQYDADDAGYMLFNSPGLV